MIIYQYDKTGLVIQETKNGDDSEFHIKLHDPAYLTALHKVRSYFDSNKIHTDVLFYTHPNHDYQIIVRKDFYVDFILSLFKHRLLESVEWQ